jgi:hypothetical protein
MTKPKFFIVAVAALTAVALLSIKVAGQSETPNDAAVTAEPAGGTGQYVVKLPEPQTIIESNALVSGVVVTKGYQRIGEVPGDDGSGLRISAVQVSTCDSHTFRGLIVQAQQARGGARSAVSYLDEDELDTLIAAVQNLAKLQPQDNRLTDLDASFRSKGDLEVINVNNNGTRMAGVRCTQLLRPTGQIVWATAMFGVNRLELLQHQLEAGKQALEGLKNPEK